jgi:hypothetical protein
MFRAAFTSASIVPCTGQTTIFCCGRVHRRPQWWQPTLVPAGFTSTTVRPASAALPVRMLVNCAQPASRIDRFSPALARALLARNDPGLSGSGLGAGRLVIPAVFRSSSAITSHWVTSVRAVLWWKSRRRLRTLRHSLASARRMRLRLPDPGRARNADATHPPRLAALRQRGVVQVAVVGQQPHRTAMLGPRGVGAELVGSSHLHAIRLARVGHCPGLSPRRAFCMQIVRPCTDISGREP